VAKTFTSLFPRSAEVLLTARGIDIVGKIGADTIRDIVLSVLRGDNLRSSTELLTRKRISMVNLALMQFFLNASESGIGLDDLVKMAEGVLGTRGRLSRTDKWLAQWVVGLTDKGTQNILRDDTSAIGGYCSEYVRVCEQAAATAAKNWGAISAEIKSSKNSMNINMIELLMILNIVGSSNLTIRGSEKSAYGKLFEKLVLSALLKMLNFKQIAGPGENGTEGVFWLSERGASRESDATALVDAGKGVRFDIGFIGRGNSEISLDKVSRFEREMEMGGKLWYMATLIIVDRIGANSRIVEMANNIDGDIVQMASSLWPKSVAEILAKRTGFKHEILNMNTAQVDKYLEKKVLDLAIEELVT
jgi:CfrBI restriction endonuclease